ncbi:MAG: tetratricopeptide repeat protein [Flavobacteriales bacterium]|nr:tetratricopeptide repeat protein [Flavobacteriales bacterium]
MNPRTHILLLAMSVAGAQAQDRKADAALSEGNALYRQGDHAGAAAAYQRAGTLAPADLRPTFNLGDALYRQGDPAAAQQQFERSAQESRDPADQARAYHNLGNSHLAQQRPQQAIEAYRQALRRDPSDEDTRYNLAYAQRMLKQQQQQQNKDQQKQEDQENKDQEQQQGQDKKDQEQQQDQQQDQQQQKPGEDGRQEQQQQAQQPQRMSREEAERLLDALDRQERDVQDKVRQKLRVPVRVPIEKDW